MSSKINISIPKPCHENWQKMTPLEKGRFCDSCQKQVFDFTKSSDTEILRKFNSEKNSCGRFLKTQLERDIVAQKKKSSFWIAGASGILSFLSLGNQEGFSQEINTEKVGRRDFENMENNFSSEINLSGSIFEKSLRTSLFGVNIENKRTHETTVSVDGNFNLSVKINDQIEFEYPGLESKVITVTSDEYLNIILTKSDEEIEEIYSSGIIVVSEEKTFFGRIFHSVGNIFR
jgi:hypothetical protein